MSELTLQVSIKIIRKYQGDRNGREHVVRFAVLSFDAKLIPEIRAVRHGRQIHATIFLREYAIPSSCYLSTISYTNAHALTLHVRIYVYNI